MWPRRRKCLWEKAAQGSPLPARAHEARRGVCAVGFTDAQKEPSGKYGVVVVAVLVHTYIESETGAGYT